MRPLGPTERNMTNYSSMKLEFLALKWLMTEKFCEYLLGHKCTVFTNNNPLSHLQTANLCATEHQWAAQLAIGSPARNCFVETVRSVSGEGGGTGSPDLVSGWGRGMQKIQCRMGVTLQSECRLVFQ